jgi:putative membrane protein
VLVALGLPTWGQVGDGPLAPMTAPPTIYSSSPPSAAISVPRFTPRPTATLGIGAAPPAARLTADGRDERMFLRYAAAQSRFELDASRMAFAKSGNPRVRTLAAALINHHNTVGLELAHLLQARGMAAPMLGNNQYKTLKRLNKLSGAKFDAVYMQQVGFAQANVARDYERASATIREPQMHAWIVKTLGNTRYHQDMAERSAVAGPETAKWNHAGKAQAKAPLAAVQPVAAAGRLNASSTR